MRLVDRIKKSFNIFKADDEEPFSRQSYGGMGVTYSHRPDRRRNYSVNKRDVTASIYNRMAVDFANVDIRHVVLDSQGRYSEDKDSGLNTCLTLEANLDQSAYAFRHDICMSMLEEGVVAIVPVDLTDDPNDTEAFDIHTMRVGSIVAWEPEHVYVRLYRQSTGRMEEIRVSKSTTAIVENPFFAVMNEQNSTLKRLARKMALMDEVDEQIGSGKLDLIIQLPYMVKSEVKKEQAEARRQELVNQLSGSNYGVAYTDGTERVIQLNRPVENTLVKNVEHLRQLLYSELGITESILNGTANEDVMVNYQSRTIEPMLRVVVENLKRKFLSKTARTQKQSIEYFPDLFTLVPASKLAEIADKFTRNAILSSNEMRQLLGRKPVTDDPIADKLVNKNLPAAVDAEMMNLSYGEENQNGS